MEDWKKLRDMSDDQIQDIWDAIWEIEDPEKRPDEDWVEDVYAQISDRGLRSARKQG